MEKSIKNNLFFVFVLFVFLLPFSVFGRTQGEVEKFFVDSSYDASQREQVSAFLKKVSQNAYFYIENDWYQNLTEGEKQTINKNLETLAEEFDEVIYPKLTSLFGSEWKPGIDGDYRIFVLFHKMKENSAGYFRSDDEYPRVQAETSNEKEVVYLNADNLKYSDSKSYLAHEFTHLITFNQKDRLRGVTEEVWLNEARADFAPTYLGYDNDFQKSNLKERVNFFLQNPSDSLTEWLNKTYDYGVADLFVQYLVDHYGEEILVYSLHSRKTGILSLEEALKAQGVEKNFLDVFLDWALAVFLNNCSINRNWCYFNKNLQNIKVVPSLIFLPSTQKASTFLVYSIKEWSGHWYRIFGGEGDLKIEFKGENSIAEFKIAYVLCPQEGMCLVEFLDLDKNQRTELSFEMFNKEYKSVTLVPVVKSKISQREGEVKLFRFSLKIQTENKQREEELIAQLKAQIALLEAEIAQLRAKIAGILQKRVDCTQFTQNLYFGLRNNEVRCLQQFLKAQGKEIYPEGLVTGFFGPLTRAAVIRFQEKYKEEILLPLGLHRGTGFVGVLTRQKINQLIAK